MYYILVEYKDQVVRRICVTNSTIEREEFLSTVAPLCSKPPKIGYGTDQFNCERIDPNLKSYLRWVASKGIEITGNVWHLIIKGH